MIAFPEPDKVKLVRVVLPVLIEVRGPAPEIVVDPENKASAAAVILIGPLPELERLEVIKILKSSALFTVKAAVPDIVTAASMTTGIEFAEIIVNVFALQAIGISKLTSPPAPAPLLASRTTLLNANKVAKSVASIVVFALNVNTTGSGTRVGGGGGGGQTAGNVIVGVFPAPMVISTGSNNRVPFSPY